MLRCGTRQLQRARQHHSPPSLPPLPLAPSPRGAVAVVSLNQQKPPPSLPSLLAAQIDFLSSVNGLALAGGRARKKDFGCEAEFEQLSGVCTHFHQAHYVYESYDTWRIADILYIFQDFFVIAL